MADRRKSLGRVLVVQRQMVRLAEWRLGLLKQQCAEIREDQTRLHAFVSDEDALSPLLSDAAFDRGRSLLQASVEREGQLEAQSHHTDTMRRRERLAEKIMGRLKSEAEQAEEKRSLQDVMEAFASRDDASFP